jgi:GAF domain-containing protein
MGIALTNFFLEAEKHAGLQGKIMLAGTVGITTGQAASMADTPELIAKFQQALLHVKGTVKAASSTSVAPALTNVATAESLRKHIGAFVDLMTQRSLVLGNVVETCRRINDLAANTLDIARVSVWLISDDAQKITCLDMFEKKEVRHSAGTELFARDFGAYFSALKSERTIAAHDAQTDVRTSCFTSVYLKPLGITSMLDVPIWVGKKMVGVVCHEHLGPARTWHADEERFAYLMAGFVSLAMERSADFKKQ